LTVQTLVSVLERDGVFKETVIDDKKAENGAVRNGKES